MTATKGPRSVANRARRGDFLVLEERSSIVHHRGPSRTMLTYRLGRVTGVARDGRATTIEDGLSRRWVEVGAQTWRVAASRVDTVKLGHGAGWAGRGAVRDARRGAWVRRAVQVDPLTIGIA